MVLQMVAGAAAGAVAKTATAPLERIKIIFQVQVRSASGAPAIAAAPAFVVILCTVRRYFPLTKAACVDKFFRNTPWRKALGEYGHTRLKMRRDASLREFAALRSPPLRHPRSRFLQGMQGKDLLTPKYTGITQTAWLVTKEEGALALWKGNGANVLRVIPVYGLKFAFNDSIKAVVAGPSKKKLDASELLWVGTLAGLLQTALTYPLETVRTRLSLGPEQGVKYNGIIDCFKQMVKSEGFGGLYKGFGPTMVSGAPYTGIQMTSYELLKRASPADGNSVLWQLLNGAISGLLAQTVTYPGDTVRRRMQNNGAGGSAKIYRNSFHCSAMIFQKEGMRGFFKGSWTNTVRAVPGAAVQFAAYEAFKKILEC
jgi:hypothetical protein